MEETYLNLDSFSFATFGGNTSRSLAPTTPVIFPDFTLIVYINHSSSDKS